MCVRLLCSPHHTLRNCPIQVHVSRIINIGRGDTRMAVPRMLRQSEPRSFPSLVHIISTYLLAVCLNRAVYLSTRKDDIVLQWL
jgi:hypothetical protein